MNKRKIAIVSGILLFVIFIISIFNFNIINKSYSTLIIALIALAFVFYVLFHFYKTYELAVRKIKPIVFVFIVYFLLIINMIAGVYFNSYEWAFVGFVIASVIFYDFKIDSRFLILPALLLLGYVPFLLIGKYNQLAEGIAIYVYYFLVVGVILQIVEYRRNKELDIDFEKAIEKLSLRFNWGDLTVVLGIAAIVVFILDRFYSIGVWKYTLVYTFFVSLIIYVLTFFKAKETIKETLTRDIKVIKMPERNLRGSFS